MHTSLSNFLLPYRLDIVLPDVPTAFKNSTDTANIPLYIDSSNDNQGVFMYRNKEHVINLGTSVLIFGVIAMVLGNVIGYAKQFGIPGVWVFWVINTPITVLYTIFTMLWHYNNWELVPEEVRATTPGKAVGFLFIPFYNFYWIFVSFIGLWKGLNEKGRKLYGDSWVNMSRGIPIAMCILILCSFIPFVSMGTTIITLLYIVLTNNKIQLLYKQENR